MLAQIPRSVGATEDAEQTHFAVSGRGGRTYAFVAASRCVWDGPPDLATALGMHGPLQALYGEEPLLCSLFLNEPLSVPCCSISFYARALANLVRTAPAAGAGAEAWRGTESAVAAIYLWLGRLLEDTLGAAVADADVDSETWHFLCRRGPLRRLLSTGGARTSPDDDQALIFIDDCPEAWVAELFSEDLWLLPRLGGCGATSDSGSPTPPALLLKSLLSNSKVKGSASARLRSLREAVHADEEATVCDSLGLQPEYDAAARAALLECALPAPTRAEPTQLLSVDGCEYASRWHHLQTEISYFRPTTLPFSYRDVLPDDFRADTVEQTLKREAPAKCVVRRTRPDAVSIVLARQRNSPPRHRESKQEPLFTSHEICETLAAALTECFGRPGHQDNDKAALGMVLKRLLPSPPPLARHVGLPPLEQPPEALRRMRPDSRDASIASGTAAQRPPQGRGKPNKIFNTDAAGFFGPSGRDEAVPSLEATPRARTETSPRAAGQEASTAAAESSIRCESVLSPSDTEEPEILLHRGLADVQRGLQVIRAAMNNLAASRPLQAEAGHGLLWSPSAVLGDLRRDNSEQFHHALRAGLQPLLGEVDLLLGRDATSARGSSSYLANMP